MLKYKRISLILMFVLLVFSIAACRPAKRPESYGGFDNDTAKPPIPKEISQGEGTEPILKVHVVDEGQVKEMKFEEYLAGVLAGEMSKEFPEEALAAQAILARTFVMEFVTDKGGSKYEGANVSTDIEEAQAYDAAGIDDRIKQAVERTRGQVAVFDNKYIKAWFHAHAGGKTATAIEGLGFDEEEPPYIQVVESPDSQQAPPEDVNWKETFTKQEIIQAAQQAGHNPGDFSAIEVIEKGPSGRATKLKIGNATVAAPAFRLALDSTRMKSTMLTNITVSGNQVTMEGVGYGHGVGMSQWGAHQMATDGKKAEEIVQYYFKDVKIVKLWE